jgi:hypothetical protein
MEDSFLLDHERFTNHQKTTKNCKTIFTTAKGYHMNANQLTCLEAQTTTKLQTEFLCSAFETKLQMTRSERQAGSQAGRQEEIRINNTTSTSTIIIQSTSI